MPQPLTQPHSVALEQGIKQRRLWYHDVELTPRLRTRFRDDYTVTPYLESVDRSNRDMVSYLDTHLPADLAGLSVLDVGCADGLFSFWAARKGADQVVGIERNRYNHEHAEFLRNALEFENVEFRCGAVERHCPDQPFDLVLCLGFLYHLLNPLGTLTELRKRCRSKMFLTSAVDLDDGDGAPLSRLDRYATGAHGLWSFNAPMIRQLLTTAGFDIGDERLEHTPGGRHFAATAVPGSFSDHHIFADTIDQEFPINVDRRRSTVRDAWRRLSQSTTKPVAVFGAGTHTPWLLDQVRDIEGPRVVWILDDRIPVEGVVADLPVRRPTDVDPDTLGAVVISSWHQTESIRARAQEVFPPRLPIITLTP